MIRQADPDVLVLACCGFSVPRTLADVPILTANPGFAELACATAGQIYVVDGSAYFSRPGPRLVDSLEILAHLLHPDLHPSPPGLPPPHRLKETELATAMSAC
jgi:iron complex transport system substrate-binding protein